MKIIRNKTPKDQKAFTMRIPKDLWFFLKTSAMMQDVSMSKLVVEWLQKYKRPNHKKSVDNT